MPKFRLLPVEIVALVVVILALAYIVWLPAAEPAPSPEREVQPPVSSSIPVIPERAPDLDYLVAPCEGYGIYFHAWQAEKVAAYGVVHKGGVHEPPVVITPLDDEGSPVRYYYQGKEVKGGIQELVKLVPNPCSLAKPDA